MSATTWSKPVPLLIHGVPIERPPRCTAPGPCVPQKYFEGDAPAILECLVHTNPYRGATLYKVFRVRDRYQKKIPDLLSQLLNQLVLLRLFVLQLAPERILCAE